MDCRHESKDELRIVLLGKTGVGKSALGNAILGSEKFKSRVSPSSVTTECQRELGEFEGKSLAIVDTPGLFHTEKRVEEVMKELLRCSVLTMPGPHVLLLVLSSAEFSREDKNMLEVFKKVFKEAKRHTIVVFTRKSRNAKRCEDFIESSRALKTFINESCETYLEVGKTNNESQVEDLLKKIVAMVNESGSFYKGAMFAEAWKSFERQVGSHGDTKGPTNMDIGEWLPKLLDAVDTVEIMKKFSDKVEEAAYRCIQLFRRM